ncbi:MULTISPECIES: adenosylmethionine decarboxylase [Thermoactinomyces]|jgi:S-adenosylmethionine decarboxylase|uniref:S-adenosylmethionine decarboxylase proenzyme n=2 Tax=Thermoactinomyces TaxID=2023 RepID=A0A8I1AD57_THEIN|nr:MULTISPECIES: adenosylmethionine decarboxylase [Thermoactinomyces]KFZ41557.1 S-adenosylmethionine decarboxylase [Thermoactinomyces sp. Gus2-1]KYQ86368.1 S-adenosylmethionine decarboxylase proenzyme [Thermoactinomyces sp. AS95]MBA4548335.1 adenosylmethionine decarboxylase [Thermoactinomyces intermedius]MBA4551853.1 adenosylmethionine decarboxylase [Thermoactinomyces vulgaris]MBA4597184.1 adenosylmethionine decarboxylase [Thermoactinomyces vulgaris]
MEFSTFGRHVAMDAWGVDFDLLNDVQRLEEHLKDAAKACGATVLSVQSHQFEPQGATVLVLLSESHLSIHTYPEKGFAALDCYTCGHTVDPMIAIEHMFNVLKPSQAYHKMLRRGVRPIEVVQPEPAIRPMKKMTV